MKNPSNLTNVGGQQVRVFEIAEWLANRGLCVVPRVLTDEMKAAAHEAFSEVNGIIALHSLRLGYQGLSKDPLPEAYFAMLRAAPDVTQWEEWR